MTQEHIQEVIDQLSGMHCDNPGCTAPQCLFIPKAVLLLQSLRKDGWIPVTERMPEDEKSVLVYEPGHAIQKTCHYNRDWILPHKSNVTHWMPLPEPPRRGDTHE